MDVLKVLLCLLEERLIDHDNSRMSVQKELSNVCAEELKEVDSLEEKFSGDIRDAFNKIEERILGLIEKLNEENGSDALVKKAQDELSCEQVYQIKCIKEAKSFSCSYELIIYTVKIKKKADDTNDGNDVVDRLQIHLARCNDLMAAAQDKVADICAKRRNEVEAMKKRANEKLEPLFTQEDARLQDLVKLIRVGVSNEDLDEARELEIRAKEALLKKREYSLARASCNNCDIIAVENVTLECLDFVKKKPVDIVPSFTDKGEFSLSFTLFNETDSKALKSFSLSLKVSVILWQKGEDESASKAISKEHIIIKDGVLSPVVFLGDAILQSNGMFELSTVYCLKLRVGWSDLSTEWSDVIEFVTPEFKDCCVWKECPDNVSFRRRYSVDKKNPKIITKINDFIHCTAIGNVSFPPSMPTSWSVKILKSKWNSGAGIYIGVASSNINQNVCNYYICGWYFNCYNSTLWSGPPHNYRGEDYALARGKMGYVHTGDIIEVIMDTAKGELSFALNGVNLGVAYEGIPLDEPLVPCVILKEEEDSVELDTSGVKENVDSSIPFPPNITAKSGSTWDSIALTWDAVEGASFYQIEVIGTKFWNASTTNTFTKRGFLPETEYNFRVRVVRENSVGEWSDVVKGRTQKKSFEYGWWKECPDYVYKDNKYSIDVKNPRIATNIGGYYCTIIENAALPLNKVISWSIKVLKSRDNDGCGILIGVAPFDINQNEGCNYDKCGWYFYCYSSALRSGPPHKYKWKEYGSRKRDGQYIHTGDSVCIVMDTANGELSFALNGVNLGVAYEGIPLDKPLVPCVILKEKEDSVELDTFEVKENVNSSIPVPSNITAKSTTWDSITLTWNAVEGASFYQIEADENKFWDVSTTNASTKRGLLQDTEHAFRVRAVRVNTVSEWSDAVKGRTQKKSFETSGWKECPDNVYEYRKYSIDVKNPRIATNVSRDWCTIIGNTPLPLNKVTSWSIKILKSRDNNGNYIFIGVAPSDINQNEGCNYDKCGWYFYCYSSALRSGPPHKYCGKAYGPRKGNGGYVHTGDSAGVDMDTTSGELSFILNGVNLDVTYEGIPLDKPLVPCVLLYWNGDSVELITQFRKLL